MPRKPRSSPNPPGRPRKEDKAQRKPVQLSVETYAAAVDRQRRTGVKTIGEAIADALEKAP